MAAELANDPVAIAKVSVTEAKALVDYYTKKIQEIEDSVDFMANERRYEILNNSLREARAYHIQMTQASHQVPASLIKSLSEIKDSLKEKEHRTQEEIRRHFQVAQQEMHRLVRSFREEIREFLIASLPHNSFKSLSDAALGEIVLKNLRDIGLFINAIPDDKDAFWTMKQQKQVNAITRKKLFIKFVTPLFNKVLSDCGMVFVNSEKYGWLSQSPLESKSTDLRPDGFATHHGMFRAKQPLTRRGFRFGEAVRELYDCLVLFECKLTIDDAGFGQVVRYLQNLCVKKSACAILFDRKSFWLINSNQAFVQKVVTSKWINKGSKSLFQNFILANKSPWISRLKDACTSLGVNVVEGASFLGRGAFGCVFKVERSVDKEFFALKVVEKNSIERLYNESYALREAEDTKLTIRCIGEVTEIPNGAALLLSPVGTPLPLPTTTSEVTSLFELLWKLHEKGLVHGDPRVPNVIVNGKELLWIDLVELFQASPALRSWDAEILARNILKIPSDFPLYNNLIKPIEDYGKSASRENLTHLIAKVCLKLGFE